MCEKITNMQGMWEDIKASARPAKWRETIILLEYIQLKGRGGTPLEELRHG